MGDGCSLNHSCCVSLGTNGVKELQIPQVGKSFCLAHLSHFFAPDLPVSVTRREKLRYCSTYVNLQPYRIIADRKSLSDRNSLLFYHCQIRPWPLLTSRPLLSSSENVSPGFWIFLQVSLDKKCSQKSCLTQTRTA
jgi:hypothetical protein